VWELFCIKDKWRPPSYGNDLLQQSADINYTPRHNYSPDEFVAGVKAPNMNPFLFVVTFSVALAISQLTGLWKTRKR
jgi:hypothetical protein